MFEPPQRKSFLKTTCTSHGKIYKVIVDASTTKNIVSIEMVDKLKLRRKPHTTLYKVSWLSKGRRIVMDEQTLVEFEIGEYKDKVLGDIILMDACHLLLGYPWKYDVNTIMMGKRKLM